MLTHYSHHHSKSEQNKEVSEEEQGAIFVVLLGQHAGRSVKDDPVEQEVSKGSKGNIVQDFCY